MAEFNREGLGNILFVAVALCLVCSIVVSATAVVLKPQRSLNQELDRKQNILRAAGMLPVDSKVDAQGRGIDELFDEFEVRAVDLNTGEYVESVDVTDYDPIKASKVDASSRELSRSEDIATLGRRENISLVYLRSDESGLDRIVIPVRGYGLWGTLFGYLAVEGDLQTVSGLGFYLHKETPGLGGEVDNPRWKSLWSGVNLYDDSQRPAIRLVKIRSPANSAAAKFEVDALSGATLTSRGVENLIRFWTGDLGFGPFFRNLQPTS